MTNVFVTICKKGLVPKILAPLSLLAVTFLIYYPTLVYGFVFDDLPTIINYIHARTLDIKGMFFANSRWISRILNQYTYVNWKQNPFAYRIFDVCLHLVIAWMIFSLLFLLLSKFKKNEFVQKNAYIISLLTTALFLLHPVQTQTVTYITQMRLEGLVAFFVFATILAFACAVYSTNQIVKYCLFVVSFIFAAFGTGSKEIIVGLPFALVAIDWFFIAQGDWNEFKQRILIHLGYFSVVFGFLFLYGNMAPSNVISIATNPVLNNRGNLLTPSAEQPITTYYYFISQFKVILHYLLIYFFPVGLSFDYGYVLSSGFFKSDVLLPLLILFGICFAVGRRWVSNFSDIVTFSFIWFFIFVLPRASIFPSTELVCDYKTYTASFGMMLLLAYFFACAVQWIFDKISIFSSVLIQRRAIMSGFTFLVFALCFATHSRNLVWSSELLFWQDAMNKSGKARCYHNYATVLYEMGDEKNAIYYFNKAIAKDDFYAEPHINLALIYQNKGDNETAMAHYRRALEIGEGHPQLFNNLGLLHLSTGDYNRAEWCFKQALTLCPYDSRAFHNLGNAYRLQNRLQDAKQCYLKALNGDYQGREIYYSLGSTFFDLGEFDNALNAFSNVQADYQSTAFYIGGCHFNSKNYAKAAEYFEIAYKKDPNDKILNYNYALALLNISKFDKALPLFEALKNIDALPYAALHHARCLLEIGQKKVAQNEIEFLIKSGRNVDVKKEALELKKRC